VRDRLFFLLALKPLRASYRECKEAKKYRRPFIYAYYRDTKVKVTLEQSTKVQEGIRGIVLLLL
jgi:hypothetical protein